jgi:DNA-binding transcriptional LysR family regulator
MSLDLRQLATFRMVATLLSFSGAASALNYAQSTVTMQIQSLEAELDVPLFNRMGRQIELTEAGKRLLEYSERLLDLSEEARLAVSGDATPGGTLVITAPETICTYRLPPILRAFRAAMPATRLIFRPMPYREAYEQVREGLVDVGFLLEKTVNGASLHIECLRPEPMVLLAAPDHPLAERREVFTEDLDGEVVLLTERGCGYRALFEAALARAGVFPAARMEFGSVEAIKACVSAGIGIAVLPHVAVADKLREEEIVALPWAGMPFEVATYLVWNKNKWLSPAMETFIDLCREMIAVPEGVG